MSVYHLESWCWQLGYHAVGLLLMPHNLNLKTQSIRSVPDWGYKCHKAALIRRRYLTWPFSYFSCFCSWINIDKIVIFAYYQSHLLKQPRENQKGSSQLHILYNQSTPQTIIPLTHGPPFIHSIIGKSVRRPQEYVSGRWTFKSKYKHYRIFLHITRVFARY